MGVQAAENGWFARHPMSPTAIETLAVELEHECAGLDRQVSSSAQPDWPLAAESNAMVRRHTDEILGRVLALAESIRTYSDAVARHDKRVERLNARWIAAHRRGFGVPPVSVDGATPAQIASADQTHADQVRQAREGLATALCMEYEDAQADLEAAGAPFGVMPGGESTRR